MMRRSGVQLGHRLPVRFPAEYALMAILFIFAALCLGEVQSHYERYWWWDIALHTTSGLLPGIPGFLLVYLLSEQNRIDLNMRPGFVAFFALVFAVAVGTFWEIFELTVDQVVGTTMRKAHTRRAIGAHRHDVGPDRRRTGCERDQRLCLVAHETQPALVHRPLDRPESPSEIRSFCVVYCR